MTSHTIISEAKHLFGNFVSFTLAVSAFLGAMAVIYRSGGKKVLKWLKMRLFEDQNEKMDLILQNQQQFQSHMESIKTELGFVSVSQKVIFERNQVMWWRSGEDGFTTEVGNYTVKYLGVTEKELLGVNWVSRIPNEEHPTIMAEFQRALTSKSDFNITYNFRKGDGRMVKINAHATYANKHWFGILEPMA